MHGITLSTSTLQSWLKYQKLTMCNCTLCFILSRPVTNSVFLCSKGKSFVHTVFDACVKHSYVEVQKLCATDTNLNKSYYQLNFSRRKNVLTMLCLHFAGLAFLC